jgi:hypothetical protein
MLRRCMAAVQLEGYGAVVVPNCSPIERSCGEILRLARLPGSSRPHDPRSHVGQYSDMLKWDLVGPSSRSPRLTLKNGYSRNRLSDRRIHRQIEGGTRSHRIYVYPARNEQQKTDEEEASEKVAVDGDAGSVTWRFGSCSPNYSGASAEPTTASCKACVTNVLCTGRANSRRTSRNSFLRSGSNAVCFKSGSSRCPGTAAPYFQECFGRDCTRGRKAPCVWWWFCVAAVNSMCVIRGNILSV